jgi:hypothetical protein
VRVPAFIIEGRINMYTTTNKMKRFRKYFLREAKNFAKTHEGFDSYAALEQVLDDDDICNDITRCKTTQEVDNIVEYAADHYIWY